MPGAVARFVRGAEAGEAELSVVVIDDWQRRGVASALLTRLVERARESGIDHFVALVLDQNSEAVELAERLSPAGVPRRRSASGNVELLIPLPSPGADAELVAWGRAPRRRERRAAREPVARHARRDQAPVRITDLSARI